MIQGSLGSFIETDLTSLTAITWLGVPFGIAWRQGGLGLTGLDWTGSGQQKQTAKSDERAQLNVLHLER